MLADLQAQGIDPSMYNVHELELVLQADADHVLFSRRQVPRQRFLSVGRSWLSDIDCCQS